VLLAARLTGWKGQRVLIEAAACCASAVMTDAVFVLAGDPQGREAYVRELERRSPPRISAAIVRIQVGHVTDMPAA
jgi:hypothetical protein